MRPKLIGLTVVTTLIGPMLRAQGPQQIQEHPVGHQNRPFPSGQYRIEPHLSETIGSLNQLIKMSSLIVDGTIVSNLPPFNISPNSPTGIQTDSLVSVHQAIRGKAPAGGQLLLLEQGGQQGQWQVSVNGDPLVQGGERYILFLAPTTWAQFPNSEGILPDASAVPRYIPVGYANGKARANSNGIVQFLPGAIAALHTCDNTDVTSFIGILNDRIAVLFPTPPPYPGGVTPLIPPNGSIFPPNSRPGPAPPPAGRK